MYQSSKRLRARNSISLGEVIDALELVRVEANSNRRCSGSPANAFSSDNNHCGFYLEYVQAQLDSHCH